MSSGSVYSETLRTITTTKLDELSKKRNGFEKQYSTLLAQAQNEQDALKRLILLVDATKTCFGIKTSPVKNSADGRLGRAVYGGTGNVRLETDLRNIDRFLEQAKYDPSLSSKIVKGWEDCLLRHLEVQSKRFSYADLFGKLVTEWLSAETKTSSSEDVEMGDSFEEIPGKKKMESRAEWEKAVFEPAEIDIQALDVHLAQLFGKNDPAKKDVAKAMMRLRKQVEAFESSLVSPGQFSVGTLQWTISGLLGSDLLTNEKRAVLRDFARNNVILAEIADVLNMRMAALSTWTWGTAVPVEQRKKLNGTYSIYMHEDLLQAIFLQYIGVKWSVFFKSVFTKFRSDKLAWKSNRVEMTKVDRQRRDYYLGGERIHTCLQVTRRSTNRKNYFLFQLMDHPNQTFEMGEGEEEAEALGVELEEEDEDEDMGFGLFDDDDTPEKKRKRAMAVSQMHAQQMMVQQPARQMAAVAARPTMGAKRHRRIARDRSADGENSETDSDLDRRDGKRPMENKQDLLHLLSAEIAINTGLYGELTCLRTVFENWNPSLPHATILRIMNFFGVSIKWLDFMKKFLRAPLRFIDDETAEPRMRQRGTPGSHVLSDVFGECIRFCLDFSINQETSGALSYRVNDDLWFWHADYEKVVKAWECITQFTQITGTSLHRQKTGTVRVTKEPGSAGIDNRLPKGQIRWGFLVLSPKDGRFRIDQEMVNTHIEELRKQLRGKSKSIFGWISAWNAYAATFFSSNFGKAANCFGREHVDEMLATHRRIQAEVCDGSSVVEFLKNAINERFGVADVPDGFLYFPIELGGLDLKSPFVNLLQIHEAVHPNPAAIVEEYQESERDDYTSSKRIFDKGEVQQVYIDDSKWMPAGAEANEFFPFEEFVRYREEVADSGLLSTYRKLLERPSEQSIDVSVQVQKALEQLGGQGGLRGILSHWGSMEPYWRWIAQLYGPEVVEEFGGLNIVDARLLPIGMVGLFREKRIKWEE